MNVPSATRASLPEPATGGRKRLGAVGFAFPSGAWRSCLAPFGHRNKKTAAAVKAYGY